LLPGGRRAVGAVDQKVEVIVLHTLVPKAVLHHLGLVLLHHTGPCIPGLLA
jgi:hypothetical protein